MIYLLHGFGSTAKQSSTINAILNNIDTDEEITAITYPYWDSSMCEQVIDSQITDTVDATFIGVSLGGFWARYFAKKYTASLILINPSLDAPNNTKKYIGQNFNGTVIADDYADNLKPYNVGDTKDMPVYVIVSTDDDVVDPKLAIDTYTKRGKILLTSGGHQLKLNEISLNFINTAINNIYE